MNATEAELRAEIASFQLLLGRIRDLLAAANSDIVGVARAYAEANDAITGRWPKPGYAEAIEEVFAAAYERYSKHQKEGASVGEFPCEDSADQRCAICRTVVRVLQTLGGSEQL